MPVVRLPPVRLLDDFLLNLARFSLPVMADLQRWNNRVINNLLYYQSNYALVLFVLLMLGGYFYLMKTLLCAFVLSATFSSFVWMADHQVLVRCFRRKHPNFYLLGILLTSSWILFLAESVTVFLWVYIFPFLLMVIHASLRRRDSKNKAKLSSIGLKRTPMGILLEALGQEQEAGS
ncbi:PRA1 family protein 2-like [Rhinatrema bivittatum]|uniref:PRA1 family protein 2 n=1 Tax=Rhinatrema bivittatum TaxID=194408 RepID=UPI00112C81A4|nr:PRA1 family protein 2 [Rhinatrema bivittatum]XP_029467087.1 PRA1 family protein 2-like [Rhinatrema bivittatum]